MPIYEYQCENCRHQFEEMQSISAEPLVDCPSCSKPKLRRLFGVPGLIFKGPGWTPKHFGRENDSL